MLEQAVQLVSITISKKNKNQQGMIEKGPSSN